MALQGGVAYFQGFRRITRAEWHQLPLNTRLDYSRTNFPASTVLDGFARLAPSGVDKLNATPADGARNFEIHSEKM